MENPEIEAATDPAPTRDRQRLIATDFFALLRPSKCRLRVRLRAEGVEEAPPGAYRSILGGLGREHERRHLARFPNHVDLGGLPIAERAERTARARRGGRAGDLPGRVPGRDDARRRRGRDRRRARLPPPRPLRLRDPRLEARAADRRRPLPRLSELQLATYGWLYEQTFGEPPVALQVHGGGGEIIDLPYEGGERALEILERDPRDPARRRAPPGDRRLGQVLRAAASSSAAGPRPSSAARSGCLPWVDRGLIGELERHGVETLDELLERFDERSLAELERPWGRRTQTGRRGRRADPRRRPVAGRGP